MYFSKRLDNKTKFKLIDLVRQHPILYTRKGGDRIKVLARRACWNKVASELSLPAKVCIRKFLSIREGYRKKLSLPEWRNGSKQSILSNKLSFLRNLYVGNEKYLSASTYDELTPISTPAISRRPRVASTDDSSIELVPLHSAIPTISKNDNHSQISTSVSHSSLGLERATIEDIDDELSRFFMNMANTAGKFSAQLQIKIKRMITDVVYDAEEQWLNEQKQSKQIKIEKEIIDITDD